MSLSAIKKSKLQSVFEEESTVLGTGEETTFSLNSSTVPTYEEFTKKTNLYHTPKTNLYLNSTQVTTLVTDDESDEETIFIPNNKNKNTPLKNPQLDKVKGILGSDKTPKLNKQDSPSKSLLKIVLSPTKLTTPKSSKKLQLQLDSTGDDEYIMCKDNLVQTSFIDQSVENTVINDSIEIIEINEPLKTNFNSYRDNSNTKEFNLHLSLSNSDDDIKEIKQIETPPLGRLTFNQNDNNVTVRRKTNIRSSINNTKNSKKRVSICGQALSDDVFNIDDTIIDQFDNEQDHKKGLLCSIVESSDEIEPNERNSVFSSTKILSNKTNTKSNSPPSRADVSSSDNDDAYEKFLNQYKPKTDSDKPKPTKNDLKKFLVEDSMEEDSDNDKSIEEKENAKKKVNRKLIDSGSTSKNKPNKNSSSSDKSDSDSDFNDQYDKDLQLFYIRTTNKLINLSENKNLKNHPKSEKKTKKESIIELNDSTASSSSSSDSDSSSLSNNSSDSADDSFSRLFKKKLDFKPKIPQFDDNRFFKTPKNQTNREPESRLVKTQYIPRKETVQKLSFIESLSKHLDNEESRDPSVEYYIKKFHMKSVKNELLQECYKLFNRHAFNDQLPHDMRLIWSDKITSTAGYCKYSSKDMSCEIHVSTKVCSDPERLRDTLAHEMCHAAAFLISFCNDNHGPIWKSWTRKVNFAFKHIPKITVTHSYSVTKKFIFKCTNCHLEIHRFSKSINVEKEVCGICHGRFEIIKNTKNNAAELERIKKAKLNDDFDRLRDGNEIVEGTGGKGYLEKFATPRQPNKFSMYVKENYGSVKKEKNLTSHKDVMQELSKNFKLLSAK